MKIAHGDASKFESEKAPALDPRIPEDVLLKFMRSNNLIESVELEIVTDENENLYNVELVINPTKETAVLTTFDTTEAGSVLWRSTNLYSMVSILDSKVKSSCNHFVEPSEDNESPCLIFGGTALHYRGHIAEFSCYPLGIDFKRDFIRAGLLGKGSSGYVYKCSRGRMQFAVKRIGLASRDILSTEVDSMVRLSGIKHVVQIYVAWCEEESGVWRAYIAMELFQRNLDDYLEARTETNMEKSTQIFTEVMSGVHSIHKFGIIQRDLKPNEHTRGRQWTYLYYGLGHGRDKATSNSRSELCG